MTSELTAWAEKVHAVLLSFYGEHATADQRDHVASMTRAIVEDAPPPSTQDDLAGSLHVDDDNGPWYVRILDEDVHHTTEEAPSLIDWTRDGRMIGVELLGSGRAPSTQDETREPDEVQWSVKYPHTWDFTYGPTTNEEDAREEAACADGNVLGKRNVWYGPWVSVSSVEGDR